MLGGVIVSKLAVQKTLESPLAELRTKFYFKAAHQSASQSVCLPGLSWKGCSSVSLTLLPSCKTVQSFARLLQVKVSRSKEVIWKIFTSHANIIKYPGNMLC